MNWDTLRQLAHTYIDPTVDYQELSAVTTTLETTYASESSIAAGDLTNEQMANTENGLIVTPMHAAHCLKDIMRTKQFMAGVHAAINHQLTTKKQINILYAGCGPYATLITPLLALFTPEQLTVTMLDYSDVSIEAVQKLYASWNLNEYVSDFITGDATNPNIFAQEKFDIIISETMQRALENECQVPITRNLVSRLAENGTFIPQKIIITAQLVQERDPCNPKNHKQLNIGEIYNLDFTNIPVKNHQITLELPTDQLGHLELETTIQVFEGIALEAFDSGLTQPFYVENFTHDKARPKSISFQYMEESRPCFHISYKN